MGSSLPVPLGPHDWSRFHPLTRPPPFGLGHPLPDGERNSSTFAPTSIARTVAVAGFLSLSAEPEGRRPGEGAVLSP